MQTGSKSPSPADVGTACTPRKEGQWPCKARVRAYTDTSTRGETAAGRSRGTGHHWRGSSGGRFTASQGNAHQPDSTAGWHERTARMKLVPAGQAGHQAPEDIRKKCPKTSCPFCLFPAAIRIRGYDVGFFAVSKGSEAPGTVHAQRVPLLDSHPVNLLDSPNPRGLPLLWYSTAQSRRRCCVGLYL